MFKSIVVGTDGSQTAAEAVKQAAELAKAVGAQIHLVTATPAQKGRRGTADDEKRDDRRRGDAEGTVQEAAKVVESSGVEVETYARDGDPADAILDVAEEQSADLIIVGNKGMTGAKRFLLGSVPDKVAHHASCTVLIIRTT